MTESAPPDSATTIVSPSEINLYFSAVSITLFKVSAAISGLRLIVAVINAGKAHKFALPVELDGVGLAVTVLGYNTFA